METIAQIRLLYHVKKKSISEIARQFRLSRNTVYKYLHHDGDVPKHTRRSSAKPQLGPHEAILQKVGGDRIASAPQAASDGAPTL